MLIAEVGFVAGLLESPVSFFGVGLLSFLGLVLY